MANCIRKRRSFTQGISVSFICALLSHAGQYWNTLDLTINACLNNFWQIYDEIGRTSNDRAFRSFCRSIRGLTFSRGDCWDWFLVYTCLRKNKQARWIQLKVRVTDHKCGIGISSIFDTAYRYFFFFFFFFSVVRFLVNPRQCPPLQLVNLREVIIIGLWLGKIFVFWIYRSLPVDKCMFSVTA